MCGCDEEQLREAIRAADPWRDMLTPPAAVTAAELRERAERRGGRGSPVVGYMRSAVPDDPRFAQWENQIESYARDHGLKLIEIMRDDSSAIAAWRPTIDRLISLLESGACVGVIVPSLQHLGRPRGKALRTLALIQGTTAWVLLLDSHAKPSAS